MEPARASRTPKLHILAPRLIESYAKTKKKSPWIRLVQLRSILLFKIIWSHLLGLACTIPFLCSNNFLHVDSLYIWSVSRYINPVWQMCAYASYVSLVTNKKINQQPAVWAPFGRTYCCCGWFVWLICCEIKTLFLWLKKRADSGW